MNLFVFDLDSTVTKSELLPDIARATGMGEEMSRLTQAALDGAVPFAQSFTSRFNLLRHIPLSDIHKVADQVEIDAFIGSFIRNHCDICSIATGNADLWVKPITDKLGCRVFASHAQVIGKEQKLVSVLDKADVMPILRLQAGAGKIIAVGDSYNDIPMFEAADFSIAYAGVNEPVKAVKSAADKIVNGGKELTDLLETLVDG